MPAIINDILQWYRASGIQDIAISIPLVELIISFLLLTVCLLLRFARTGLIISYLFTYRWGWFFCLNNNIFDPKTKSLFLAGYVIFGILALTLTIIAMTISSRASSSDH
jgi:hypothetical protein